MRIRGRTVASRAAVLSIFLLALGGGGDNSNNKNRRVGGVLLVKADAASAATNSALATLKNLDYRYFVAGGTCAAISHGVTTPIDVVKTRIQSEPRRFRNGMKSAAIEIIKEDGPQALLGGLGPTVFGYGVEGAMKFGVYEVMKPVFAALLSSSIAAVDDGKQSTAVAFLMASATAGAVASLILCPMESTRIKMVTDRSYAKKAFLPALIKLSREEGLLSTFSGIWAMLAKQVPYTFGKQVSFDVFAAYLYVFFHSLQERTTWIGNVHIKWAVSVTAAFLASIVACIFSQPGDMILTETYGKESRILSTGKQRSFPQVVSKIYDEGGILNFFTGTGARIVHVGLIITSQLVIYDIVKQLLGLPATGSH